MDFKKKLFKAEIIFFLLCFLPLCSLSLAYSDSQIHITDQHLTIHVNNIPLENVLRQIAEKANISIIFHGSLDQTVSIDLKYISVEKGLKRLLSKSNFSFIYQKTSLPGTGSSIVLKKVVVLSKNGSSSVSRFGLQTDEPVLSSSEVPARIFKNDNKPPTIGPIQEPDNADVPRVGNGVFVKAEKNIFKSLAESDLTAQLNARTTYLSLGLSGGINNPDDKENPQEMKGVQITDISEGNIFSQLGLKTGDIIQDINGTRITEAGQVAKEIHKAAGDQSFSPIRIEVERGNIIEPIYIEME